MFGRLLGWYTVYTLRGLLPPNGILLLTTLTKRQLTLSTPWVERGSHHTLVSKGQIPLRYPARELVCEWAWDQLASWIAQWNLAFTGKSMVAPSFESQCRKRQLNQAWCCCPENGLFSSRHSRQTKCPSSRRNHLRPSAVTYNDIVVW